MLENLTINENRVYEFLKDHLNRERCSPNFTQIAENFGFKSKNSVTRYVNKLKEKGYISYRKNNFSTTLAITAEPHNGLAKIRIEGTVSAGLLSEAIEDYDTLEIPASTLNPQFEYFALKVKGDSMIGAHIVEGDIVVIKNTHRFRNGMIGVAKVDGEATLKKIFKTEEGLKLVAENPAYDPIIVSKRADIQILGELSQVIRRL